VYWVIEGIVRGRHAATSHHFDLGCAEHQLLANSPEHGVDAIGDHRRTDHLSVAEVAARIAGQLVAQPEVTMARRLGDERTGWVDPRTGDDTLVDSPAQSEGRSPGVAHRREPPPERPGCLGTGDEMHVPRVRRQRGDNGNRCKRRMPMRIDQPGIRNRPAPSIT